MTICNDESNAIRALELLQAKGVITNLPVELQNSEKIIDAYIDSGNIGYLYITYIYRKLPIKTSTFLHK